MRQVSPLSRLSVEKQKEIAIVVAGHVHIDHIVPVSLGGHTELSNLRPAHATCNMRRGARMEIG